MRIFYLGILLTLIVLIPEKDDNYRLLSFINNAVIVEIYDSSELSLQKFEFIILTDKYLFWWLEMPSKLNLWWPWKGPVGFR